VHGGTVSGHGVTSCRPKPRRARLRRGPSSAFSSRAAWRCSPRAPAPAPPRLRRAPRFPDRHRAVRQAQFFVAPLPDLQDRRSETPSPSTAKMNHQRAELRRVGSLRLSRQHAPLAQRSSKVQAPARAVAGTIERTAPELGNRYTLAARTAPLICASAAWHLPREARFSWTASRCRLAVRRGPVPFSTPPSLLV